jgi:geranylgeranyl pyrophosphate synthase
VIQSTLYSPVHQELDLVDQLMRRQAVDYHTDLQQALDLILSSGGKRIRAAITLLVSKMMGADLELSVTLAAAIEMLHTATLVHDDLIDGALLRRGMPTLNSHWSPGATVLTGDFLFARAAKLAADTNSVRVMKIFSETLGVIVNGEISQLFSKRYHPSRSEYYKRIYAKTASLFETSTKAAAILSNADEETIENMGKYGYSIGMAFQIIDDVLDFTGEQVSLGKPIGSDLRQGLITLPSLYYIETHADDPVVVYMQTKGCLDEDQQVRSMIQSVIDSDAIQQSLHEAIGFVEQSLQYLHLQPENEYRESLEMLARYIVDRTV